MTLGMWCGLSAVGSRDGQEPIVGHNVDGHVFSLPFLVLFRLTNDSDEGRRGW
jgi:hypothetical protein